MKKKWSVEYVVLALIMLLAFQARLKGIHNSVTDWHAFRQADTASVTREYVKHGVQLLVPKYHDFSNIQSGFDNPHGYRMVEFPFVNAGIAVVLRAVPSWDLVLTSRLTSILFSLGTVAALYFLGKQWSGRAVGALAALVFAVLPYAVYYSRVILPEPAFIFFITASLVTFQAWLDQKKWWRWGWFFGSAACLALALLLKPFGLFLGPVYLIMLLQRYRWRVLLHWELAVYAAIAFVPLYFWRHWILQFPQGIPVSDWLYNGDGIRLRPAWFRWLFWERLTKLILGGSGVLLLASSLVRRESAWVKYVVWWACIGIYFVVMATGNVRHDYYQVFTLPIVCLSVARGMLWLWEQRKRIPLFDAEQKSPVMLLLIAALFGGMLYFADKNVRGYYGTRADWEVAGQAADRLLPPDAKIIAPAMGDTAFLFQTKRTGWPLGFEIEDKIAKGAQYYVTTSNDDEARALSQKYQVIAQTPDYIIIHLVPKL